MILARTILVLLLAIAIPGCATLIQQTPGGAWVGVEPGGLLTLHQSVTVPSGRTRVWLVNGRLSAAAASYRTACALEVRDLPRAGPRTIPTGSWRIRRIQNYWTEVVSAPAPEGVHFRLAGYGDSGDGGYSMIRTGYHFWLEHGDRSGPTRLTCLGVLADPPEADPPSLTEIAEALGRLADLDLRRAAAASDAGPAVATADPQRMPNL